MTPAQKKEVERYLVGQGVVRGGGFLGMLASIGVPLAIDLVKRILGKGLQTQPPRPRRFPRPPFPKGREMQIRPPPFFLENGAIFCAFLSKVFLAEMNRNLCFIPCALSTWMILEIWELIGCVVGVPKMEHTNISTHLGFRHL